VKHSPVSRSRRNERGYTVVEVLSALTLFAIGAGGVIGMQRATIQGGMDARNFDMATNIAREWQNRLQRDSLLWTSPNSLSAASNLDSTLWLGSSNVGAGWVVPAVGPQIPGYSAAFDMQGRDIDPTDVDHVFCTQYRLDWIAPQGAPSAANITSILRAEIRVFWARLENGTADCSNKAVEGSTTKDQHHFVYVTTAIRPNPPPL
jgi:hypothetical protein